MKSLSGDKGMDKIKKSACIRENFESLMSKRITEVLLICNDYDAFILEADGRIEERFFSEYSSLYLRFPPHFSRASSYNKALGMMKDKNFDLVIALHNTGSRDAFEIISLLKKRFPSKIMAVVTPFPRKIVTLKDIGKDKGGTDYVFSWLGDSGIIAALIKLIEDSMNADDDIKSGVQIIILVEDSIRYYSAYLPLLYEAVFEQALHAVSEEQNDLQKNLRMRGRPKILLATDYEQALSLYKKYSKNLIGIITDVEYSKDGALCRDAGIQLCAQIRQNDPLIPLLVQSSLESNREKALEFSAGFINKRSDMLLYEVKNFIRSNFGFCNFYFYDPTTLKTVAEAKDLKEMLDILAALPAGSIEYHSKRNDFSKWFRARTLFGLADTVKDKKTSDFKSSSEIKNFLISKIQKYKKQRSSGVITNLGNDKFDELSTFVRIGHGSIGGKARGLAYMDRVLKSKKLSYSHYGIEISIPQTVVVAAEYFQMFLKDNDLYETVYSDISDGDLVSKFVASELPQSLVSNLESFLKKSICPLAVRSSGILEDSYYQPFSGIYSTYMIPNDSKDFKKRQKELCNAIKCVYASAFFQRSKKYLSATKNVLEEEMMAVVIQKVSGKSFGNYFYPTFSGVARSINNYPVGHEKHDISIANVAAGLGKTIVDGEVSLRFSPLSATNVIQLSSAEYSLKYSQKHFYALKLGKAFRPSADDSTGLEKRDIYEGYSEGAFRQIVSTYDHSSGIIRDSDDFPGPKVVTFARILKYETFPLSAVLTDVLGTLEKKMGNPVEIEFAVNIDDDTGKHSFDLLQARPVVTGFVQDETNISLIDNNKAIIKSFSSLGNGIIDNISDIVYVVPEKFDPSKTEQIASAIRVLNKRFTEQNKNYILIGPGRWGTSDPWLGIPVRWEDISQASVIVEAGQKDFIVQQSQGSHFFHNIITFGIFYFSINPFLKDGFYDIEFLAQFKAEYQDDFLRHISFETPVKVKTDGKNGHGLILKPQKT